MNLYADHCKASNAALSLSLE